MDLGPAPSGQIWRDRHSKQPRSGPPQDLPARASTSFGGQAVIEGVMMRGRHSWGVAVRRPSGEHRPRRLTRSTPAGFAQPLAQAARWSAAWSPSYESLSLGIKALGISANIGLEDADADGATAALTRYRRDGRAPTDRRRSGRRAGAAAAKPPTTGEGRAARLRVEGAGRHGDRRHGHGGGPLRRRPPGGGQVVRRHLRQPLRVQPGGGLIRIVIFLLYIVVISLHPRPAAGVRVPRRRAQGHPRLRGLRPAGRRAGAQSSPPMHPRCGTGFLLLVMVIAVFAVRRRGQAQPALAGAVAHRRHPAHHRHLVRDGHQVGRAGIPTGSSPASCCGRASSCSG